MAGSPAPRGVASDPVRAALWMVASCACFAVLTGIIRHLSATLDPLVIVFFRNLFAMLVMLPWLTRRGLGTLRTRQLPLYALRAAIGLTAMISWFVAVSRMNLADAVALSFTAPMFATVAAALVLGEVVRLRRWSAVLVGFAGAMVILRPGFQEVTPTTLICLLAASMMGASMAVIKLLSRTEPVANIVFYMVLFLTPASLVPALFVWRTPGPEELVWLVGLGGAATLGHLCLTRAFALAEATAVLPFDFARLPFIALVGYLAFGQPLDAWTGAGAAIILAASVYIARREAMHRRAALAAPPRPRPAAVPAVPHSGRDAAE